MSDELIKKFQEELFQAGWELLDDHLKRKSLVFIQGTKDDLFEVAVAIAEDNSDFVKQALVSEKMKVLENQLEEYTIFDVVIVQPFVLICPHQIQ